LSSKDQDQDLKFVLKDKDQDKDNNYAGRPARSAAMPVLFLLSGLNIGFFAPQGRHVAPINVKFGTAPPCQISRLSGRNVEKQPPKLSNLPVRGHSFAQFLRNFQILYAATGGF